VLIPDRPNGTAEFSNSPASNRDHAEEARVYEMKAQAAQQILAVSTEDVYGSARLFEILDLRSSRVAAERGLIASYSAGSALQSAKNPTASINTLLKKV
jgi:hypothetical protein